MRPLFGGAGGLVTGAGADHPAQLVQAIRSVARLDPRACQERVQSHFDTDQMAVAYATLYEQLCRGPTR